MYRKRTDYTRSNTESLRLKGTDGITRIAICGKLRSGKSLIAEHLVENQGFHRIAFGDALKRYADEIFPHFTEEITAPDEIFGGTRVIGYRKPRALYQTFGQAMREIDPDIWLYHAERTIEALSNMRSVKGIVIDDLRQPNEEIWARDNGFTIIRVNANEDTRLERARALGDSFEIEDLRHETELHIDDIEADYDIWNDGDSAEDVEDLKREIDDIMSTIGAD